MVEYRDGRRVAGSTEIRVAISLGEFVIEFLLCVGLDGCLWNLFDFLLELDAMTAGIVSFELILCLKVDVALVTSVHALKVVLEVCDLVEKYSIAV